MGQGENDSSLMLLWLLPKAPAGPEFTFHLTFDKCYEKKINTDNNSIQFVTMLTNLNTTEALTLIKLRSCKN